MNKKRVHIAKCRWILALMFLFPSAFAANPSVSVTEFVDSELYFGSVKMGNMATEIFQLTGLKLTGDVVLDIDDDDDDDDEECFSVTPNRLKSVSGILETNDVVLTYKPDEEGYQSARLTISSPKTFPITINLKGSGVNPVTGLQETTIATNVWGKDGRVIVQAADGEEITIYNVMGQKLCSQVVTNGQSEIYVGANRVVLIKMRCKITKIVL